MSKILIATDSFKGTLSSKEIGETLSNSIENSTFVALADGGEGSLESLSSALNLEKVEIMVSDVAFNAKRVYYLFDKNTKTAYIESALIVGLDDEATQKTSILNRTTFGIGQAIEDAIKNGAKNITIFLGGTSTNDCGLGMLEALGWNFYNQDEKLKNITPNHFAKITNIFCPLNFDDINFTICSDVTNPLCGPNGASHIYGLQKGLTNPEIIDGEISRIAKIINEEIVTKPGAGAAGGLGYALQLFPNNQVVSGATFIAKLLNLEEKITNSDIVIGGEGKFDHQSFNGKLFSLIKYLTAKHDKKFIVVCGINETKPEDFDQTLVVEIKQKNQTVAEAIANSQQNLIASIPKIKNIL